MDLPTFDAADRRLAELLAQFPPGQITERQRAEDLVAAALAMYGGAFRRLRQLHEQHSPGRFSSSWSEHQPLGRLLALHRADSPAPPPVDSDEVRRATTSMEGIIDELEDAPGDVRDRSMAMLNVVLDLHEAGLAQVMGVLDPGLRPPAALTADIAHDHLVASVLLIHGLHPEPVRDRLERLLDELRRSSEPVATVRVVALDHDGVHLRVDGASENDAYRLRLTVERALADRMPDLTAVHIDGGAEPVQPTSVLIPVESLTVRRSGASAASPSAADVGT